MFYDDFWGLIVSLIYVFLCFSICSLLERKNTCNVFYLRKVLHICMANWWFIRIFMFENCITALLGPAAFVILNFFSVKKSKYKYLRSDNFGTSYFSISLLIMVGLSYTSFSNLRFTTVTMLILGYGDAFAAIIGKLFGKKHCNLLNANKTYFGSITFFLITFGLINISFRAEYLNEICTVAIISALITIVELISVKGIDNLLIPMISYIMLFTFFDRVTHKWMAEFVVIFIACLVCASISYRKQLLTKIGILFAFILGLSTFIFGNLFTFVALIFFFGVAVIFELIIEKQTKKKSVKINYHETRKGKQVFVTGIVPLTFLVLYFISDNNYYILIYLCVLNSSLVDTVASTVGKALGTKTISITSLKSIDRGISGGISFIGTVSASLSSLFFSIISGLYMFSCNEDFLTVFYKACICFFSGVFGMLIDSIIGDTLQVKYKCPICTSVSDNINCHGKIGSHYKGFEFFSNNFTNIASNIIVGLMNWLILIVLN